MDHGPSAKCIFIYLFYFNSPAASGGLKNIFAFQRKESAAASDVQRIDVGLAGRAGGGGGGGGVAEKYEIK